MRVREERQRKTAGIRRWPLFELRLLFFSQRPQNPLKRLQPFVRSYTFIWATAYKILWIDALRAPKVAAPPAGNSRKVLPAPQPALPRLFTVIKEEMQKLCLYRQKGDGRFFKDKLAVINYTIAWNIGSNRAPYKCVDIDPLAIYKKTPVVDPLAHKQNP